jgi:CubicO group peptidase (beta-lactamase class C family)
VHRIAEAEMTEAATHLFSRRDLLRAGSVAALAGAVPRRARADDPFAELDGKVRAAMAAYAIPGVAVGIRHQGREVLKCYGVTNVDDPLPVDEDTLFRIASTTKLFTGTAAMRLVEDGRLDLDGHVRTWLPGFATADPAVAEAVTLRQLLNHTPGWLGDTLEDFGPGDDALARYVEGIARLPQLTPPGSTFFYNNAAITLAGHLIATVTGTTYERAVRALVLEPLGLAHTGFWTDEMIGRTFAAPHMIIDGKAVVEPLLWPMPRTVHPTGGLISSLRDQLAFARFHLGDGRGPDGATILSRASLEAMRTDPGPGGTLYVELDGMGVTFQLRPTAEGVAIAQHGGDWGGQHSGFLLVPERDFALVVLTNSDGGPALVADLTADDWTLSRFLDLHNMPADLRTLGEAELAAYEGDYVLTAIGADGAASAVTSRMRADRGGLSMALLDPDGAPVDLPAEAPQRLGFYRDDYALVLDGNGEPLGYRTDFVRDGEGRVAWFRFAGRLSRKVA